MACAIVAGYSLDCKDTVGGIKSLFITEQANITAVTENASGYVTAITKVTDLNVNASNALEYLIKRYPLRQNIVIIEITYD